MILSQLLHPDSVHVELASRTKKDAIVELVDILERSHGLHTEGEILDRVLKREALMSTGIGDGIAIPHGKSRSLDRFVAACGVSRAGVDFDAIDKQPVSLLILLVSPDNAGGPHVKVLANISRLLKHDSVREALKASDSGEAFLRTLREAEAKYL